MGHVSSKSCGKNGLNQTELKKWMIHVNTVHCSLFRANNSDSQDSAVQSCRPLDWSPKQFAEASQPEGLSIAIYPSKDVRDKCGVQEGRVAGI